MPHSIGDDIREDIGGHIDYIVRVSIAHHFEDIMIYNMSDILREAKLFCSIDYQSPAPVVTSAMITSTPLICSSL
jgi:hypothetical protein